MSDRTIRRQERERLQKPKRLPFIGGPLGHTHKGEMCSLASCQDAKTRELNETDGLVIARRDWDGEYRRTSTGWWWTPPPKGENHATDRVNVARLPTHPSATVLANHISTVSKRVRADGTQATRWAAVLAARGLPRSTGGGGSRSADPTTSVERAAGLNGDDGNPTPFDPELIDVDRRLAQAHRDLWLIGLKIQELYTLIFSHADDKDPIPAGTGSCRRCGTFWRPTAKKPNNRIKSGYGPCCFMTWYRARKPDKALFDRTRTDEDIAELVARLNGETAA